jgi:periodic tryptophan protein 2
LDGNISFWDPQEAEFQGFIEGRRDIKGGRLASDRRAAGNLDSGACFSSLSYGADGSFLITGGLSKYVCVYDTKEKLLLRRFQTTKNKSIDGVLDTLNSSRMTDAGPLQLIDHEEENVDLELLPPNYDPSSGRSRGRGGRDDNGAASLPGSSALNAKRPVARTRCIALSPTNRCWAAAGTEGLLLYRRASRITHAISFLHIYCPNDYRSIEYLTDLLPCSLDEEMYFDPTDLTEELTPASCHKALASGSHSRALLIALRLGDAALTRHCLMSTPADKVKEAAKSVPGSNAALVLSTIADLLGSSPHFEFLLEWSKAMCVAHGQKLSLTGASSGGWGGQAASSCHAMPALRSLQKTLNRAHEDLSVSCEGNVYLLSYLLASGEVREKQGGQGKRAAEEDQATDVTDKGTVAPGLKKKKADR